MTAKSAGSAVITAKTTDGGKTATCTVTVEASGSSSVATLSYLILFRDDVDSPTPISPDFDADTVSYASMFVISNSVSAVSVLAAATDSGATISGAGTRELATGVNVLSVLVTAADGITTKTYTISVERQGDPLLESVYLRSLTAFGLSIDFGRTNNIYTVNAPYDLATTTITAVPESSMATMEYKVGTDSDTPPVYVAFNGSEDVALAEGEVTIVWIKVTSQYSNDYLIYSISISRALASASSDASLSSLVFRMPSNDSVSLSPVFDPALMSYTGTVSSIVWGLRIEALAADAGAIVEGTEDRMLSTGENSISVKVTAADGATTKTYSLVVTRRSPPVLTLVNPASGDSMSGNVSISGTYSDPFAEITSISVGFINANMVNATFGAGSFSAPFDAATLTNGLKQLMIVADCLSGQVAWTSADVSVSGGVSAHSVSFIVDLASGVNATTGYLNVWIQVAEGSFVNYSYGKDIETISFPYSVTLEGIPDGSYKLIAGISIVPFSEGGYTHASIKDIVVAGADLNAGTLELEYYAP